MAATYVYGVKEPQTTLTAGAGDGADAVIMEGAPPVTDFEVDKVYSFIATGTNTTAVTLKLDQLDAKAIQKNGVALVAGDITTGDAVSVVWDGTQFQMTSPARTPVLTDDAISGDKIHGGTISGSTSLTAPTITGAWTASGATCADLGAVTTADINAGTVDATIGGTTPADGSFTSVTVDNVLVDLNTVSSTTGDLNLSPVAGSTVVLDGTITVDAGVVSGITDLGTVGTADINGGTVDGAAINATTVGAGTASTGAFTTLSSSGLFSPAEDIDQADGKDIKTDQVRARDGDGLSLHDDGGNGIRVLDGGAVTFSTAETPAAPYIFQVGDSSTRGAAVIKGAVPLLGLIDTDNSDASWNTYNGSLAAGVFSIYGGTSAGHKIAIYADGGVVLQGATGASQGNGTLNAVGVYDDGAILSCYVFEEFLDGTIDLDAWNLRAPAITTDEGTKQFHFGANKFSSRIGTAEDPLDIDKYIAHWKAKRHLTSMPNKNYYTDETRLSTGEWAQRLIETVEIQAVHIAQLHDRVTSLEAKLP